MYPDNTCLTNQTTQHCGVTITILHSLNVTFPSNFSWIVACTLCADVFFVFFFYPAPTTALQLQLSCHLVLIPTTTPHPQQTQILYILWVFSFFPFTHCPTHQILSCDYKQHQTLQLFIVNAKISYNKHINTHIYKHKYICQILHTYIYIYIYTHTHTHTHSHTHTHTEDVMGKLLPLKLSILRMCFICFRFCLLCCKREWVGHFEESSTMTHFTSPEIWKWYAVQCGVHFGSANTKILKCLGVNLKMDSHWYKWKANTQSISWCLGWWLVMVILCLHSSSHMASDT